VGKLGGVTVPEARGAGVGLGRWRSSVVEARASDGDVGLAVGCSCHRAARPRTGPSSESDRGAGDPQRIGAKRRNPRGSPSYRAQRPPGRLPGARSGAENARGSADRAGPRKSPGRVAAARPHASTAPARQVGAIEQLGGAARQRPRVGSARPSSWEAQLGTSARVSRRGRAAGRRSSATPARVTWRSSSWEAQLGTSARVSRRGRAAGRRSSATPARVTWRSSSWEAQLGSACSRHLAVEQLGGAARYRARQGGASEQVGGAARQRPHVRKARPSRWEEEGAAMRERCTASGRLGAAQARPEGPRKGRGAWQRRSDASPAPARLPSPAGSRRRDARAVGGTPRRRAGRAAGASGRASRRGRAGRVARACGRCEHLTSIEAAIQLARRADHG
jgi:hypothetical protein